MREWKRRQLWRYMHSDASKHGNTYSYAARHLRYEGLLQRGAGLHESTRARVLEEKSSSRQPSDGQSAGKGQIAYVIPELPLFLPPARHQSCPASPKPPARATFAPSVSSCSLMMRPFAQLNAVPSHAPFVTSSTRRPNASRRPVCRICATVRDVATPKLRQRSYA